jgi:hypothetical protein
MDNNMSASCQDMTKVTNVLIVACTLYIFHGFSKIYPEQLTLQFYIKIMFCNLITMLCDDHLLSYYVSDLKTKGITDTYMYKSAP